MALRCPNRGCSGILVLEIDDSKRKGFSTYLKVHCSLCSWKDERYSSQLRPDPRKRGQKNFEVNVRMVVAFREIGKGHSSMLAFTQAMNMPPPIAVKSYNNINKLLLESYQAVSQESQKIAANETRQALDCVDENPAECQVSVDGTWQKRGFSSLNGAVTIMSKDSSKCIDTVVMSKSCKGCLHWKNKKGTPEYDRWRLQHNCKINHKGSSGAMECAGAIEAFRRSVPFLNLKYTGYLGDGDTKSFQQVVDSAPYENNNIQKLECVGHVQKRMGTRLRNLRTEKKGLKLADGKGIAGKGRLTDKVVNLMQNYYGMAIRQNVDNVYAMKKSIIAILYHCSQNDNEDDRHKFCPRSANSWCSYQSDKHTGKNTYKMNVNLPAAISNLLKPIFKDLSHDELLKKCTHGLTQNSNESIHNIIWQKCPKTVYVDKHVLDIATASAVIAYNDGSQGLHQVMRSLGIEPGYYAYLISEKRDHTRINKSNTQSTDESKERRKKLRAMKKGFQDKDFEDEGEVYASGAF